MDVDARPCSSPVARSLSPPVNEPNLPDSPSHSLPQVEEDFITSLEILPELWNLRHIHYKNKYKREAGYKKLLKILKKIKPKATTEDVRKKINSLRSNYRRELKKITASKRSGAGADDLYTPKSKSFKLLSFLYNTEKSDNSPQDLITENAEANDDNTSEANTAKRSEYEHSSRPSFSSINPVVSPSPLIKSKKQNSLVAKQNELLDRANLFLTQSTVQPQQRVQETTMSDSLAFVWANKLEKLHPQQRFFAVKAIHDISFEAGLGNLHRFSVKINENSSQSHYSPSPSLTKSRLKTNENFSQSIRNSRKIKRNTGQAYVTESGKEIRARFCHDLTPCRNKCYIKFDTIKRKELFDAFWSMQSYDRRADYINSLMMAKPKATTRKRTEANNRNRDFTFYYYFKIDGELHKTCKVCFTKTFDITEGFLKIQHSKILLNSSSIRNTDQRGQHSPPNKTNIDRKNEIISHINSFPKYESHYSRRHTEKKYLPPNLNISKMYSLYKETNANPVSYNIYRTIFKEMKIGFKVPYNDTCQTCDTFKIRFKIAQEEEKPTLEREWNIHKEKADFHYEMKAKDKTESKQNHSLKLISFDLQQVLQTPYLLTSVMFYKRQLAVYNLTVHEGDTGIAYNYLWNETIAGRGANQIGSCLNKYIQVQLSPEVEHLIMYSDTCTGQNRNSHVAAMCFSALKQSPTLKCIDHKFMISGHSHMECDTAHAAIEKKKKTTAMDIHHPRDWIQLIRSMGQKYFAIEMLQEEFYDYKKLYPKDLQLKTKDDENNKFVWHDVQWMRFLKEESCIMLFKHSLDPTEPFKRISFKRKGKKL